jgi:hypothetical protein
MQKTCKQCGNGFEISEADLVFYARLSPTIGSKTFAIPTPTLCPRCRAQRRLSWRNERKLYHRKCDLTGKQIISIFSDDKPITVYDQKAWWSDKWDALSYGLDFDFNRSFFEQFDALLKRVPQMNVIGENNENSDYCNLTANCKNCYLVFESSNNEDCLYGYWQQKSKDCCDVSFSHECERCYELDNCYGCYDLRFSRNCTNCFSSSFLLDCIGCKNCLFCVNLRQKEYCIFNKQVTKEEYEKKLKEIRSGSYAAVEAAQKEFEAFCLSQVHRHMQAVQAEDCTGDYIQESQHCYECFHAHLAEDCAYAEHVWRNSKNNMDVSTVGRDAELIYESINTGIGAFHDLFCNQCWSGTSELLYCSNCFSSKNCLGCIGLVKKQYCIFNKQYSKEDYEILAAKIIEHMRDLGEWGEFFPATFSPFGYNETVAQEQFPLSEQEAVKLKLKWHEEDENNQYLGKSAELTDSIAEVDEAITKEILRCTQSGKLFKIIPQELAFYKSMNLPLPRLCPEERHRHRMSKRNPNRLWTRNCSSCGLSIQTTYSPERTEKVLCEACYLKTVY